MARAARHRGRAAALVIAALAILAASAMFSGEYRPPRNPVDPPAGRSAGRLWLGAELAPARSASPGGAGLVIEHVWNRSPARSAGLKRGDVILSADGSPVASPSDVAAALAAPGERNGIVLVVARDGAQSRVRVLPAEKPRFARDIGGVLALLAAVFALLYFTSLDRVAVVGCGAVLAVAVGTALGFYDQKGGLTAIRLDTLALLLGTGLVTAALEETGFFAVVARRIGESSRGDPSRLMALLCATTFFLSSFVNNLTTILVMLPVTLNLAAELRLEAAPLVIGEIVSSNLGGASSMIGDFPNMLIASETGRHFHDFLLYMMPPCLVQLAVTVWWMRRAARASAAPSADRAPAFRTRRGTTDSGRPGQDAMEASPRKRPLTAALVPEKAGQALAVLAAVIIAFLFCGGFGIAPATVALAGGFLTLLMWGRDAPRLVGKGGFGDILFFAGLFVLVGSAEAAGMMDVAAVWLLDLSGGDHLRLALALMWGAAVVTTFLNAGPTAALFVPVVAGLGTAEPKGLLWWALSLGVCAGSSATVTGATAGPVAVTKMEEFARGTGRGTESAARAGLSFVGYARAGVPLMFVFLAVSSAYVWGLSVWP